MNKIKVCDFEVDGEVTAELFMKVEDHEESDDSFVPTACGVCYAENSFEIVDGKWRCIECGSEYCGGVQE